MEIPYIAEYQTACEIVLITNDAQYDDPMGYALCSAKNSDIRSGDEFDAVHPMQDISFADRPTPLPLFPDNGSKQSVLPYFDKPAPPSLADDESDLDAMLRRAYEKDYVTAARGFEVDGNILIVALTTPFFLKSERDLAMLALENELDNMSQAVCVTVCFDLDIFRHIEDDMSKDAMRELLQKARRRSGSR